MWRVQEASADAVWELIATSVPPIKLWLAEQDEETREAAKQAYSELFPDGVLERPYVLILGHAAVSYRDEVVELLQQLIRLDTVNPPGNETLAAELLRDYLEPFGVECELYARSPERANLVARIRGPRRGAERCSCSRTPTRCSPTRRSGRSTRGRASSGTGASGAGARST